MQVFWEGLQGTNEMDSGGLHWAGQHLDCFFGPFPMAWKKNMNHQTKWAKSE